MSCVPSSFDRIARVSAPGGQPSLKAPKSQNLGVARLGRQGPTEQPGNKVIGIPSDNVCPLGV